MKIENDELKVVNADHVIEEMHKLFLKNQTDKKSVVDDFISKKRNERLIEESRGHKNV